jgi:hypothetical protein
MKIFEAIHEESVRSRWKSSTNKGQDGKS